MQIESDCDVCKENLIIDTNLGGKYSCKDCKTANILYTTKNHEIKKNEVNNKITKD